MDTCLLKSKFNEIVIFSANSNFMSFLAGLLVKKPELRWHSKQLMSIMMVISANKSFNKFVVIALQNKLMLPLRSLIKVEMVCWITENFVK